MQEPKFIRLLPHCFYGILYALNSVLASVKKRCSNREEFNAEVTAFVSLIDSWRRTLNSQANDAIREKIVYRIPDLIAQLKTTNLDSLPLLELVLSLRLGWTDEELEQLVQARPNCPDTFASLVAQMDSTLKERVLQIQGTR